jgi:small subunit ribosomal protein S1
MKQLEGGGGAGAGASTGGASAPGGVKKGDVVTVTVRAVQDAGLDVQVGQKFDAMVIGFDRSKKPNFSIKAMQIAEEKQAVAQYGSSDSGASLGDILGAALKEAQESKSKKKK